MTDPDVADVTYIEPIHWKVVENIIAKERPDVVLPTMGGQTALNCALDLEKHGVLAKYNVEMIGAKADAIDKAENRERFDKAMKRLVLSAHVPALPTAWTRHGKFRNRLVSHVLSALHSPWVVLVAVLHITLKISMKSAARV